MGRMQVFSELLQPTSRPGANPSANNVTRNIPPCLAGKMQIGSSPLLRRTSDKVFLQPRSLFGVFLAWNISGPSWSLSGGSEGRAWSWDARGCSSAPLTHPRDLAALLCLPLFVQHPRTAVTWGILKLGEEQPRFRCSRALPATVLEPGCPLLLLPHPFQGKALQDVLISFCK